MKWTFEIRKGLFKKVKEEFGNYSQWQNRKSPEGNKREFLFLLKKYADYLKFTTGQKFNHKKGKDGKIDSSKDGTDAVRSQLEWGITAQKYIKDRNYLRNWVLCKAAALESKFIENKDLPKNAVFDLPEKALRLLEDNEFIKRS